MTSTSSEGTRRTRQHRRPAGPYHHATQPRPRTQRAGLRLAGLAAAIVAVNVAVPVLAGAQANTVGAQLWAACTVAVALVVGVRERNLTRRDVAVGGVLAAAVVAGYAQRSPANPGAAVLLGVWMLAGWLGTVAALRAVGHPVPWYGWSGAGSWRRSLGAAVLVGGPLAAFNVVTNPHAAEFDPSVRWLLLAVQPGLLEEVSMRLALVALAMYLLGGWPRARWQVGFVWAVGILPHSFAHVLSLAGGGDLGAAVQFTLFTSLIFGLPLFVLLRRYGLAAAIGAHWLIDAVRFVTTGGL